MDDDFGLTGHKAGVCVWTNKGEGHGSNVFSTCDRDALVKTNIDPELMDCPFCGLPIIESSDGEIRRQRTTRSQGL